MHGAGRKGDAARTRTVAKRNAGLKAKVQKSPKKSSVRSHNWKKGAGILADDPGGPKGFHPTLRNRTDQKGRKKSAESIAVVPAGVKFIAPPPADSASGASVAARFPGTFGVQPPAGATPGAILDPVLEKELI